MIQLIDKLVANNVSLNFSKWIMFVMTHSSSLEWVK